MTELDSLVSSTLGRLDDNGVLFRLEKGFDMVKDVTSGFDGPSAFLGMSVPLVQTPSASDSESARNGTGIAPLSFVYANHRVEPPSNIV